MSKKFIIFLSKNNLKYQILEIKKEAHFIFKVLIDKIV